MFRLSRCRRARFLIPMDIGTPLLTGRSLLREEPSSQHLQKRDESTNLTVHGPIPSCDQLKRISIHQSFFGMRLGQALSKSLQDLLVDLAYAGFG